MTVFPEQLDLLALIAEVEQFDAARLSRRLDNPVAERFSRRREDSGRTVDELAERWRMSAERAEMFLAEFSARGIAEKLPDGSWRATEWGVRRYRVFVLACGGDK